ncbi:MAG: hypothetical protein V3R25_09935 [Nitrosomonadaceae bacterium]
MGLLSSVTDAIGVTDTGAGARAARQAGQASAAGAAEAKGYLSPLYEDVRQIISPGFDASQRQYTAGAAENIQSLGLGRDRAVEELNFGRSQGLSDITGAAGLARDALGGGRDLAVGALQPLADASYGALGYLQEGATPGGYAANVENLRTGGALNPLIAENRRNLESELAAQGLTRSGQGITDMSQIPIQTLMGIEGDLYGRQGNIYQSGLPAISNIAQLESQYGRDLGSLEMGVGQDLAGINTSFAPMLADVEYGYGQQEGAINQNLRNQLGQGVLGYHEYLANTRRGTTQDLANIASGQGAAQSSAILAGAQAEAADRSALGNIIGTGAGIYAGM